MSEEKIETKQCKKCKENIPKNAERCKYCGAHTISWFGRHIMLSFIIFFVAFLFIKEITSDIRKSVNIARTSVQTVENIRESISPEKLKEDQQALATLKKRYDDIEKVTFYTDPSSPNSLATNNMHLYIVEPDGGNPFLRLRISYTGDDWLFIEKYIFSIDGKSIDGKNFEIIPDEVSRDNTAIVWEWFDGKTTSNEIDVIMAIIDSKEAKMRYAGQQYYHDRVITTSEKTALKNVIMAFEALVVSPK